MMRSLLGCLALAAGCGGERIAECDAMLATVAQVRTCGRLDATQRMQVDQAVRSIQEALDRIEAVGPDRISGGLMDEVQRTCARQGADLRERYGKVAPECVQ